jgi:hypothetical protein
LKAAYRRNVFFPFIAEGFALARNKGMALRVLAPPTAYLQNRSDNPLIPCRPTLAGEASGGVDFNTPIPIPKGTNHERADRRLRENHEFDY